MGGVRDPDPLIVFSPSGRRGRFPAGTTVLQAARSLGVDLDSVCGGRAICGRCQVDVVEGELSKHGIVSRADHLSTSGKAEERFRRGRGSGNGRRLGCQARLLGDVAVDVPVGSQVHRQVVRKAHEARNIEIDPIIRACYVEVEQPEMHSPSGDLERLVAALDHAWGPGRPEASAPVRRTLQATLREGHWKVTAAVRDGREIVALWPGFRDRLHGVAIDVGSTTIAAHLCDLASGEVLGSAGCMNPQIRFGEDLMSRISYVMMNPAGDAELTAAVREAINGLIGEVSREAGIDTGDVVEMTLAGNPVMMHLVLGLNPVALGAAPFALASDSAFTVPTRDIVISIAPGGYAYALPCIAGHVGADTAGVLLAEAPYDRQEVSLIVDVGTNAELLLGNRKRLLAASSPTGPAFEGAQISAGQRAAPGAIERVRIDRESLEPRFRIIGCERWSDDPDFERQAPAAGVTGICGSGIIEAVAELYLAGVIRADGSIDGDLAGRSSRIRGDGRSFSYLLADGERTIVIRQSDVRAIQLAKAALHAGAALLMEKLGVDRVDRIRLAGAFGAHIDVKYAMVLGMIPDCPLQCVSSAGNAAGTGARIALLNKSARARIEDETRKVEKIETAVEPRFQHHFVAAMSIPHETDPFNELRKVVDLPTRQVHGRKRRPTQRARRRKGTCVQP